MTAQCSGLIEAFDKTRLWKGLFVCLFDGVTPLSKILQLYRGG